MCNCFQFLVSHAGDLDLCMSLTSNDAAAANSSAPAADGVGESEKMMSGTSAAQKSEAVRRSKSNTSSWKNENVENSHPNTVVSVEA